MDSNLSRGLHYPQPREEEGPHAEMKRKKPKKQEKRAWPIVIEHNFA